MEEYEEGLGQAVAEFVGVPDLVAPAAAFGSPEYMADLAAREAQQAVDMGLEGVEMTRARRKRLQRLRSREALGSWLA